MRAALYARVSTKDQKEEGSSLKTQIEACRNFAEQNSYEVPNELVFEEDWTGASLDRPKLDLVRGLVRGHDIDDLIVY
jgi:site-specific DNA recombinase